MLGSSGTLSNLHHMLPVWGSCWDEKTSEDWLQDKQKGQVQETMVFTMGFTMVFTMFFYQLPGHRARHTKSLPPKSHMGPIPDGPIAQ